MAAQVPGVARSLAGFAATFCLLDLGICNEQGCWKVLYRECGPGMILGFCDESEGAQEMEQSFKRGQYRGRARERAKRIAPQARGSVWFGASRHR